MSAFHSDLQMLLPELTRFARELVEVGGRARDRKQVRRACGCRIGQRRHRAGSLAGGWNLSLLWPVHPVQ